MTDKEEDKPTPAAEESDTPDEMGWIKDLAARYRELYPGGNVDAQPRRKKK